MLHPTLSAQAIQIKIAIADRNRNRIDSIDRQFGLKRLTRVLVHYKLLTPNERKQAINLRSYIHNPSLVAHTYRGF